MEETSAFIAGAQVDEERGRLPLPQLVVNKLAGLFLISFARHCLLLSFKIDSSFFPSALRGLKSPDLTALSVSPVIRAISIYESCSYSRRIRSSR